MKDFHASILLKISKFFNSKEIKKIKEAELSDYGNKELNNILDFYCTSKYRGQDKITLSLCNRTETQYEWNQIKRLLYKKYKDKETLVAWKNIWMDVGLLYPNLYNLSSLILSLPVSSVACERGFSLHKITKNKLGNCLSDESVDSIMRIILEGDDVEKFDFGLP